MEHSHEPARPRSGNRPGHNPFGTILLALLYGAGVFFLINGGKILDYRGWLAYVVVGIGLLALLWIHSRLRYKRPLARSHTATKIIPLDGARAYDLQRRASRALVTPMQATTFFLAVVQPAEVQQRVVERYTPGQRTMKRQVLIEGHLSHRVPGKGWPQDEKLLMPIAVPRKGWLYDNFAIDNGNGDNILTLAYSESLELVACVIRTLLCLAYRVPDGNLPEVVVRAEHLALIDVMHRGEPPETPGLQALRDLMTQSHELYHPPRNQVWFNFVMLLVEKLASRYVVVARADCDKDGRFIVRYEQTVIPPLLVAEDGHLMSRAKGRLRILLGARPVNLQMSLHTATRCKSYHLYVHSEESLYLSSQESPDLLPYFAKHTNKAGMVPPHYRFRSRLGQSYAHFYSRYFPPPTDDGERAPLVHFRFYEKPPGSTFRAAIASVACFLLVWLIGYVSINADDPKTDAPAFLLIVPALAAALLGFESSGRRLLEGTLASRFSLIVTAAVSLAASGLYLVSWAKIDTFKTMDMNSNHDLNVLWLDRTPWSALVLVALFNALYITYTYFVRAWEFTHMATQPKTGDTVDGS